VNLDDKRLRGGFALVGCAAALLGAGADATHVSSGSSAVVVTITSGGLEVAPVNVLAGTLVFKIANRGKIARDFAIGGKRTPQIAAGKSATLTVNLAPGFHSYSSVARNRRGRITGLLSALEPCTQPVATTVSVQMTQSPGTITASESTIPCGTVTFLVTNAGSMVDDLDVFADLPQERGASAELRPGQTASLIVRFVAKGTVLLESGDYPPGETEEREDSGEQAQLTIV